MPPISKNPSVYMGIDPGGGIATISQGSVSAVKIPPTEKDLWLEISACFSSDVTCVLEKVWGHVGQNQPGSAMFNFGMGYGMLKMALVALGIPFEEVVPRTWQKAFGISPRGKTESKTQWKNRLKAVAQKLFPNVPLTLSTCDALLIAEFCRRKSEGKL